MRKHGFEHIKSTKTDRELGCAHFSENEISESANNAGFEIIEKAKYEEPEESRPFYADCSNWKKPFLNHNWYVLRKKDQAKSSL